MESRAGHYMKADMLRSQFDALEEPSDAITVDVTLRLDAQIHQILGQLGNHAERAAEPAYALGILGLGVMGRSLAQNFERNGYPVIGYDPAPRLPEDFTVRVTQSLPELTALLKPPRVLLMMVPAGAAVDSAIASLRPHLQPGDIIVDGGNSFFSDTERRSAALEEDGILFVGMGVSGGESGALWGPSLMPGGSAGAWQRIAPMFEAIAARAEDGAPCVGWMGSGGAGHYVKTVHNGIEYGDMQLIAEIYDLLHRGAGLSNAELATIFARWNEGELRSYLIEITARILARSDEETGQPLVDLILDEAAQKGTGKWTAQSALDVGAAVPTLSSAVTSRLLSSMKDERVAAEQVLGSARRFSGDTAQLVAAAEQTLYACKVTAYAQGLSLLRMASEDYGWGMNFAAIVRTWRAGCIIRAGLLDGIAKAFERKPDLPNLLVDDTFSRAVVQRESAWRHVVQTAVALGIPVMSISASLAYFDSYRSARLPANLIQAQRDYFGAHTYRRVDKEGLFHTQWELS
jgi:6-phosphogluconate dehydrogenase